MPRTGVSSQQKNRIAKGTKVRCCRAVTVTHDQRSGIAAKQPN
jgi:hypothetical protein